MPHYFYVAHHACCLHREFQVHDFQTGLVVSLYYAHRLIKMFKSPFFEIKLQLRVAGTYVICVLLVDLVVVFLVKVSIIKMAYIQFCLVTTV